VKKKWRWLTDHNAFHRGNVLDNHLVYQSVTAGLGFVPCKAIMMIAEETTC